MKRILCREAIMNEVDDVHKHVVKSNGLYMERVGAGSSLLDYLVLPVSRMLELTPSEHAAVKGALLAGKEPDWKKFTIYNLVEIGMMRKRWEFCAKVIDEDKAVVLRESYIRGQDISEISLLTTTPTVHLAIKYFCICQAKSYSGLPAMTEPVQLACKALFGSTFECVTEAKQIHTELAFETGLDEINVNSALWVFGQRLKNLV